MITLQFYIVVSIVVLAIVARCDVSGFAIIVPHQSLNVRRAKGDKQ